MAKSKINATPNIGKNFSAKLVEKPLDLSQKPIFSFEYPKSKKYSLAICQKPEKLGFIQKLDSLSQMTWLQLINTAREGSGIETIEKQSLTAPIPQRIMEAADIRIISIRFRGSKCRIIGYRKGIVFHILLLDRDLSAYKH